MPLFALVRRRCFSTAQHSPARQRPHVRLLRKPWKPFRLPPQGRFPVPDRLQRKRTPGSHLPPGTVCVDRSSKWWGNPFALDMHVGQGDPLRPYLDAAVQAVLGIDVRAWDMVAAGTRKIAVAAYELWLADQPELTDRIRRDLRGKDLADYCPLPAEGEPDICHASILLAIANQPED
jgi:Domain of unknown function (DUF4326)